MWNFLRRSPSPIFPADFLRQCLQMRRRALRRSHAGEPCMHADPIYMEELEESETKPSACHTATAEL